VSRVWWPRVAGALAAFVGIDLVLSLSGSHPDPLRLALLVGASAALLGLVAEALSADEPSWQVEVDHPSVRDSGDPRLVRYVALLEAHLSARTAESALRDRLAVLTRQVIRQRHGLDRVDPAARELLDAELAAVLSGPPHRMRPEEIDRCLTLIEEL
jgi:hypothetical protein